MENYFYAQLDSNNICIAISSLSGEVIDDVMIRLESMENSILGKKFIKKTNSWEDVILPPSPTLPFVPTQMDAIQADVEYVKAMIL